MRTEELSTETLEYLERAGTLDSEYASSELEKEEALEAEQQRYEEEKGK